MELAIAFGLCILFGCSENIETSLQPTTTESLGIVEESPTISKKTITPISTKHLTETPTESPTTEYPIPTKELPQFVLDPTATIPPTLTMTPLSTISPDEGSDEIFRLIKGNEQCRLPCWSEINLGETGWAEVVHISQPYFGFATSQNIYLDENCAFGPCNVVSWRYGSLEFNVSQRVYFSIANNTIYSIFFEALIIPRIDGVWVKDVLNQYGSPSVVLIDVNPYSPDGFGAEVFTHLLLGYPDYQFIIVYSFNAQAQGEEFVSCIPNSNFRLLILSSETDISSLDRMNASPILSELMKTWRNGPEWYQLESVTDLTIETFVEEYTTKETPCFATPIDIWR